MHCRKLFRERNGSVNWRKTVLDSWHGAVLRPHFLGAVPRAMVQKGRPQLATPCCLSVVSLLFLSRPQA